MQFSSFSVNDLKRINLRTIERLRSQEAQGAPNVVQGNAKVIVRATVTADGIVTADATATPPALAGADFFGNSKNAEFSRNDIRNALIVAKKKLSEKA